MTAQPTEDPRALGGKLDWQIGLDRIAHKHGFTVLRLREKGKFQTLVNARKECYAYLRDRGWSLPSIGRFFNRDHTTVMWSLYPETKIEAKRAAMRRSVMERKLARALK